MKLVLHVLAIMALLAFGNPAYAEDTVDNSVCIFPFAGDINDDTVAENMALIYSLCNPRQSLEIHVFSQGGSEQAAFTFYNFLRRWPGGVDTVAVGNVLSAAVPIFLAGEHRTVDWSSVILVHPAVQYVQNDVDLRFLRERTSFMQLNDDIYVSIIAERTGLTLGEVYRLNELSEAFGAERAVELGFAHEVMSRP